MQIIRVQIRSKRQRTVLVQILMEMVRLMKWASSCDTSCLEVSNTQIFQGLWYFMTNILDNTLGVLICVICLRAIEWSLLKRNRLQYISGNYYSRKRVLV